MNIETRLQIVEADIQRLFTKVNQLPIKESSGQSTSTVSTALGTFNQSLKRILNWGFEFIGNKVNVKPKTNGGIVVDTSGVSVKVRSGYGISLDANGLALKKQGTITGPTGPTLVAVIPGTDTIDLADLNDQFVVLHGVLSSFEDSLNGIINALQNAEVTS